MTVLLYLIGAACGIAFFLYMLSMYNSGKESLKKLTGKKTATAPALTRSGDISKLPIFAVPPGERMCPLCRTMLSREEALYASKISSDGTTKIMIHGCRYCYKQD